MHPLTLLTLLLPLTASALPASQARSPSAGTAAAAPITPAQLLAIMPQSSTCAGAAHPDECRTAAQAAPFVTQSFSTYGVTTPGEQAALLGIMGFESEDFKYNKNYYPGNPGQGTRNMQSAAYNEKYAASISALQGSLAAAGSDPNSIRALVLVDQYSFASAAWFLTTQCGPSVRTGLQSGSLAGWQAYISGCVGTTPTDDRMAYWTRAKTALGIV